MKLLFLGDIVGRSGRDAAVAYIKKARHDGAADFVVANGDNAAGGFGIIPDVCKELLAAGADVVTGGDHIWDQKEIIPYLATEKRLLRPENFPDRTPGTGHGLFTAKDGRKVLVLHLLGQVFHKEHTNCPFATADKILAGYKLGAGADAIMVDMHAEATSEKMAMGQYLDGRISLVVGSHTHIPTNDAHILKGGTAYQTDAGMCGDYDSVIGMDKEIPLKRFLSKIPKGGRMEPACGVATVCGTIVETDDKTGVAKKIEAVKVGGILG